MSEIETAVENLIQFHIDENDFITRMDAEQYIDNEVNDARADMESELSELQSRIEALEEKTAPAAEEQDENLLQELADSAPRPVNQIDWILGERAGSTSIFAGYPTIDMLEQFVRSTLGTEEESKTMMIIMMTLATARNLINEKLEAES